MVMVFSFSARSAQAEERQDEHDDDDQTATRIPFMGSSSMAGTGCAASLHTGVCGRYCSLFLYAALPRHYAYRRLPRRKFPSVLCVTETAQLGEVTQTSRPKSCASQEQGMQGVEI
jgi:hypothetical protein